MGGCLKKETVRWLLNWFKIGIPAIGYFGVQLSWAIQRGFVTPELSELGLSSSYINYAWLAAPISGLIAQPIIGIISDSMDINNKHSFSYKYGRRRPFIFIGCILEVFALNIFSNARYFKQYQLFIGLIAFWLIDISNNMISAPLRTLISDIIPKQYHSKSNGLFGLIQGIGQSTGHLLGFFLSYNKNGGISLLFGIGSIILIFMCLLSLYLTKGEKLITDITLDDNKNKKNNNINNKQFKLHRNPNDIDYKINSFAKLLNVIKFIPKPVSRAFYVQFFLYFASFGQFIYLTDWFGRIIFGGDPKSENKELVNKYHDGIKLASLSNTFMSFLSIFIAMIIPKLTQKYGYKLVWMFCMIYYSFILISISYCKSVGIAIILIAATCVPRACSQIIGWSIVTESLIDSKFKATYSTIFNMSQCLPQITFSLLIGHIIQYFNNDLSYVMFVGGLGCSLGVIATNFVVEP